MAHSAAPAGGGFGAAPGRGGFGTAPGRSSGFTAAQGRGGGYAGPRANGATSYSGSRFVAAPGARYGYYTPNRSYASPRFNSGAGVRPGNPNFAGRAGFNRPAHGIGFNGRPRNWGGGNFHGSYWPRSYYHSGFIGFVPLLPAFYSTFWWGGVPYYYWDDTYYTWSQPDYGYVATDPPPAAGDDDGSGSGSPQSSDSSSLYIYPKNGQSEEQTSTDRYECHQWAAGQTGFDPTNGTDQSAASAGPADYRRAMTACLDARGYSAR
ncbi:MAG: hypothetical protein WDO68_18890 [Gammaproteobacteria bacterium]